MMKKASIFYIIAMGILIGIILIIYNYNSFLSSNIFGEILIIAVYSFLIGSFVFSRFRKKITVNCIRIRLKKLNWIRLIVWSILGSLTILQRYRYPNFGDELFGFIHERTAMGIGFIILGLVSLSRSIILDKKGIKLNDWLNSRIKYSEIYDFNTQPNLINFQTEKDKFIFKIKKLNETELTEINGRIAHFIKKTKNQDN